MFTHNEEHDLNFIIGNRRDEISKIIKKLEKIGGYENLIANYERELQRLNSIWEKVLINRNQTIIGK
jgi:hypothetical protein